MTQPPLSTSIRKLEEELGVVLFERLSTGLLLTPAGDAIVAHARRTLACVDELTRAGREGASGEQGVLRLGFVGSATYSLMPQIIRSYRRRYPAVDIVIDESTTVELLQQVDNHSIDVALIRVPVLVPTTAEVSLLQAEGMVVAVSSDSEFADRESVSMAELANVPVIAYSQARVPTMHALVMLAFSEAGIQPHIAQHVVQVQQCLGLVESGLGIAFIPESGKKYAWDGVRFLHIKPEPTVFRVGLALAFQSGVPSPTTKNFIAVAREISGFPNNPSSY